MRWVGRIEYTGETKNHTTSSHKTWREEITCRRQWHYWNKH